MLVFVFVDTLLLFFMAFLLISTKLHYNNLKLVIKIKLDSKWYKAKQAIFSLVI